MSLGRQSLVASNGTSVPLAMVSVLLTWSGAVVPSDYYHLSYVDKYDTERYVVYACVVGSLLCTETSGVNNTK